MGLVAECPQQSHNWPMTTPASRALQPRIVDLLGFVRAVLAVAARFEQDPMLTATLKGKLEILESDAARIADWMQERTLRTWFDLAPCVRAARRREARGHVRR